MKATRLAAILLAGAVVVYVLSVGPAVRMAARAPTETLYMERMGTVQTVYFPVIWVTHSLPRPARVAFNWYVNLWEDDRRIRKPSNIPPPEDSSTNEHE